MKPCFLFLLNFFATWTLAVPIPQTFDDDDGQNNLIAVVIITGLQFHVEETKWYLLTRIDQAGKLTVDSKGEVPSFLLEQLGIRSFILMTKT
jgi:hypothetical protein